MPDIYRRSKTFAAKNLTLADPEPATSGLLGQVATVQAEWEKTKLSLKNDIARKVAEMATGGGSVDTIVSEVYDSISVECNLKFEKLEKSLKTLKILIENLEERVNRIEMRLDDYDQEVLLNSLVIHGMKQQPGVNLNTTVIDLVKQKLGVSDITDGHITSVFRFRQSMIIADGSGKVAPIMVKFQSKDIVRRVFKEKAKLARTGVYITEALTKSRRDILNMARDKFGVKYVWTDHGNGLVKMPSDPSVHRIRSLVDCM